MVSEGRRWDLLSLFSASRRYFYTAIHFGRNKSSEYDEWQGMNARGAKIVEKRERETRNERRRRRDEDEEERDRES
jgi:hypothetical protein